MTAMSHVVGVFGIDACKIYPITADASGGATTYGTGISVPGIRELKITPDILSKELYGDGEVLDVKTRVRAYKATASHARLNLDCLTVFLGGTVTDAGSTPARTSTFTDTASVLPGAFKLEAQILSVDGDLIGDDLHLVLWKATADTVDLGGVMEDYSIPSLTFTARRQNGTGQKRLSIVRNEVAVALT